MGLSIEQMRLAIAECYSGWKWKNRVSRMRSNQVYAVYKKFEAEGRFQKKPRGKNLTKDGHLTLPKNDILYHQIDMFEYLNNLKEEDHERSTQPCY